ncbi:MAG: hypothetical protein JNJ60_13985 [Rhodocyclaceae bacterium]|nr:hypothetical protein [Rhodocyclaceae bacterium]
MKVPSDRASAMSGFVAVLLALCAACMTHCYGQDRPAGDARLKIRDALQALADGNGDWRLFTVVYDDLHPFHGGLTLTIHGNGSVEQKSVRTEVGQTTKVSAPDLEKLVSLLRKLEAWEQRVPERMAVPDESRARLVITYGEYQTVIWEWYNDLAKNRRISEIRDLMKQIAWKIYAN